MPDVFDDMLEPLEDPWNFLPLALLNEHLRPGDLSHD